MAECLILATAVLVCIFLLLHCGSTKTSDSTLRPCCRHLNLTLSSMPQVQGTELMALSIKIRRKSEICVTNELLSVFKLEHLRITPETQSTLTSTLLNVKQGGNADRWRKWSLATIRFLYFKTLQSKLRRLLCSQHSQRWLVVLHAQNSPWQLWSLSDNLWPCWTEPGW